MGRLTFSEYLDPNTDLGRRRSADLPGVFARIRSEILEADETDETDDEWMAQDLARQEELLKQRQGLIPYPPAPEPLQFPSGNTPFERE